MKRLIALFAAAALLGGSLAMDGAALAQGRSRDEGQAQRDNGRSSESRGNEGRQMREAPQMRERQAPQREAPQREERDYRPYPVQADPRGNERRVYQPPQPQARDERRAYSPPPPQAYEREEAPPARRGGYLPPEAGGGIVNDLSRYRLRAPPPGYAWVRVNGGVALVSQATGQIFDIVPN